jgi:hypothetical protein
MISPLAVKLLREANEAYPDEMIGIYFDLNTGKERKGAGDTLALFIGREIVDVTIDQDDESLARDFACHSLEVAIKELEAVKRKLEFANCSTTINRGT